MKVLFPINEVYPVYKIGGLGDVGGSLPKALNALDVDVRVCMPHHPDLNLSQLNPIEVTQFKIVYNHKNLNITIYLIHLPSTTIPIYLINEPLYLSQKTDFSDNHADKYAVFSLATATFASLYLPHWQPDIVHCHDWHTALIPVLFEHSLKLKNPPRTILTIHNLAYQGVTKTRVWEKLNLNPSECQLLSGDIVDSELNFMYEGIVHADQVTTVSPQYATEITTATYGETLEEILQSRSDRLTGILNGIDMDLFNPQTDQALFVNYNQDNFINAKAENKKELQKLLGLPQSDTPLFAYIGRIDMHQKGIDLIISALSQNQLPPKDSQFVFLGTGDPYGEGELHRYDQNPNLKIITRYDDQLSRRIYAAADFLIIPSNFEPCGLIQIIAMRYGTLPIANKTGGLADTIKSGQTGWLYTPNTLESMIVEIKNALVTYNIKEKFNLMREIAIKSDFSWKEPAKEYLDIYQKLLDKPSRLH